MSSLIVDVAKINAIEKHANADRLRLATVKGWNCIIGLDDFQVGDLVIFIPPDCILPDEMIDKYKLEFLKKGSRVKTIKLRGVISQGLCLPIPEGKNWKEGKSVANELGITKYGPPVSNYQGNSKETIKSLFGKYREGKINLRRFIMKSLGLIKDIFKKKRNINPLFSKYTDIENIKNFNTIFKEGEQVVITEKIHGTNFRAGYIKRDTKYFWQRWILKMLGEYEFVYGSHNVQITGHRGRNCFYGDDVYGKIAEKYKFVEIIPQDYIVYGEIYGKKIQELQYEMDDIDLVVFDVKYKGVYLDFKDFEEFCTGRLLPMVPVLAVEKFWEGSLSTHTSGLSILAKYYNVKTRHIREGCVIKPLKEQYNNRMGRIILKSINEEYLLTKKRTEFH